MKNLIIVGAGGCAREVLQWVKDINKVSPTWRIKGFIADDKETAFKDIKCDTPIIDTIYNYTPLENDYFTCAIGSPNGKKLVTDMLKSKGALFTNIIHPKAIISDCCSIGEGLIAYPYSVISPYSTCEDFVTLLSSSIGSNSKIGKYTTISSYCSIGNDTVLGYSCHLGTHVHVSNTVTVGNNNFIAAGSFVSANSKDNVKLWGNPAKEMPF